MKTIEDRINDVVEGHAECRWLDACDLRKYLEQIATEQKAIYIEKACKCFCDVCGCKECAKRNVVCTEYKEFRKLMEEK